MSTDEYGERTQRPTERRRREARARGEVPRSGILVAAMVLLAATVGVWQLGPPLIQELAGLLRVSLSAPPPESFDEHIVAARLTAVVQRIGFRLLPVALVVVGAAALSNLVQTGFLWVPSAVLPQASRIDPLHQLGRWGKFSNWVGLAASVVRVAVLLIVFYMFVWTRLGSAGPLAEGNVSNMLNVIISLAAELGVLLSMSLVVMALIDYGFQYWQHEQSLMMTVEEVLREQREENGDPRMKRARRELAGSRVPVGDAQGVNEIRAV